MNGNKIYILIASSVGRSHGIMPMMLFAKKSILSEKMNKKKIHIYEQYE